MLKCVCGGEYKSLDLSYDSGLRNQGYIVYGTKRLNDGCATRQCNKCGKLRIQKLRTKKI